ncbi:chemoreceptor glutamine deamidase CheD [Bradyrhizobium roseum]|uniref:chemoreceptor glutamine deamidase CheD n=1 Tax=Bradyrhizobium roseum TaxID=3056648 RepID=UPI00262AA263|nr:chemoreceptor glutamine deamidase CheD [Bradyrhizobium roseus]WKA29838.1 chemoreceptor glutamine deamidase CheD [Bradyrhizobium roseus]
MTVRRTAHEKQRPDGENASATGSRKYRDPRFDAVAVKVFPGDHYVTSVVDEMLVTILGSCVTACIRDPLAGVGGMNHFMLPESAGAGWDTASASMRYGNVAMERLINDILKRGGARDRLEIKVFGGGNVMNGTTNIGHRNAEFVEEYLAAEGLPIAARHLRGNLPRRVHYFPATGKVMLLELQRSEQEEVVRSEHTYKHKIEVEPAAGSAELF